jgi:hypothetical protein
MVGHSTLSKSAGRTGDRLENSEESDSEAGYIRSPMRVEDIDKDAMDGNAVWEFSARRNPA